WGMGFDINGYLNLSSQAILGGAYISGFVERKLSSSVLSFGVRYDFSMGRVLGVVLNDINRCDKCSEEFLNQQLIPGFALSFGPWVGYSVPLRSNMDLGIRLGFRNDGARIYVDGEVGLIVDAPF
ncbi:MAG: hypothetical protein VX278_09515, partial [Myxococcota bacterium]|nr:hypothetical protein [Myxococcota bacterium]